MVQIADLSSRPSLLSLSALDEMRSANFAGNGNNFTWPDEVLTVEVGLPKFCRMPFSPETFQCISAISPWHVFLFALCILRVPCQRIDIYIYRDIHLKETIKCDYIRMCTSMFSRFLRICIRCFFRKIPITRRHHASSRLGFLSDLELLQLLGTRHDSTVEHFARLCFPGREEIKDPTNPQNPKVQN